VAPSTLSFAGDFNGDGFDDLAVVAFEDEVGGVDGAGAINVFYGGPDGPTADGDQIWHQGRNGIEDDPELNDGLGQEIITGDGDGFSDLVVSSTGEDFEDVGALNVGVVHVIYGAARGLGSGGSQFLHQDAGEIRDRVEDGDTFGSALAAGDFDGDGFDDLAVSAPLEDRAGFIDVGVVHVLFGSANGLRPEGDQLWDLSLDGFADAATGGERFGRALMAADYNGDGVDDLAISAQGAPVGDVLAAGTVSILYGRAGRGLRADKETQILHQDGDIHERPEFGDRFGFRLGAGDFNDDGFADIVVGVPEEDFFDGEPIEIRRGGVVHVLYGSADGMTVQDNLFLHQDIAGMSDRVEENETFGDAFITGDFNADGFDDLAIGEVSETVTSGAVKAGAVHVLFGGPDGLTTNRQKFFHQATRGFDDDPEAFDGFGTLGAGDYNGDEFDDLAIGVSGEEIDGVDSAGAVHILFGSPNGPRGGGSRFLHQDVAGVKGAAGNDDRFGIGIASGR